MTPRRGPVCLAASEAASRLLSLWERIAMPHHVPVKEGARANLAIALTLVWAGAAVCVVGACVYDVGRWLEAW